MSRASLKAGRVKLSRNEGRKRTNLEQPLLVDRCVVMDDCTLLLGMSVSLEL